MAVYVTKEDLEAWRDALQADIRGVGVMFEQTRSDVRAVAELVLACASKTDVNRLEESVAALSERLSNVEAAVRKHSTDLRKNTEDLRLLRNEVARLRLQFDRRELPADELEQRIAEIEKRMGIAR